MIVKLEPYSVGLSQTHIWNCQHNFFLVEIYFAVGLDVVFSFTIFWFWWLTIGIMEHICPYKWAKLVDQRFMTQAHTLWPLFLLVLFKLQQDRLIDLCESHNNQVYNFLTLPIKAISFIFLFFLLCHHNTNI